MVQNPASHHTAAVEAELCSVRLLLELWLLAVVEEQMSESL